MSLRKSPERTPAFLAAQRRNAQKCTGPKTPKGKVRSSLNALKHGRFAQDLLAKIRAAGVREVEGVFEFHKKISRLYPGKAGRILTERHVNTLATAVWRRNKLRPRGSGRARVPRRIEGVRQARDAHATDLSPFSRAQMEEIKVLTPEQLEKIKLLFSQSAEEKKSEES